MKQRIQPILSHLRYKNATTSPKDVGGRGFQYAFLLTQHYKEIKNHPERLSNIKIYFDLYN